MEERKIAIAVPLNHLRSFPFVYRVKWNISKIFFCFNPKRGAFCVKSRQLLQLTLRSDLCAEWVELDVWVRCRLWGHLVLGEYRLLRLAGHRHHAGHLRGSGHHRTHLLLLLGWNSLLRRATREKKIQSKVNSGRRLSTGTTQPSTWSLNYSENCASSATPK